MKLETRVCANGCGCSFRVLAGSTQGACSAFCTPKGVAPSFPKSYYDYFSTPALAHAAKVRKQERKNRI